MNDVNAWAVQVDGGWEGRIRKVHKAGAEPVCENGVAQIYGSAAEAEVAAWRALRAHLCGDIVGAGERPELAKALAEAGLIFPGKGRRVMVERR